MRPPDSGGLFCCPNPEGGYDKHGLATGDRHGVGDRRRLHGVPHAGRVRNARSGLLPRQERRRRGREDPRQPLDRHARLLGRRLRFRLRQRQRRARSRRLLPLGLRLRVAVLLERSDLGQVPVRGRVLHRQPRDRLGHDARPHEVRRLHRVRARVRGRHLPARRPLDLGRRLPRRPRHAGLRRLDGRPPLRSDGGARRHTPPRPADRQVRSQGQGPPDPRPLDAPRRARRADPVVRLVRLQPRLHPGGRRRALRRHRRHHQPRCRGRRARRRGSGLHRPADDRRGLRRQRCDRRPRRDHRTVRVRGQLGGGRHRPRRRWPDGDHRHRRRPDPCRRPDRCHRRPRHGRYLGHALLRPLRDPGAGRAERRRPGRAVLRRRRAPAGRPGARHRRRRRVRVHGQLRRRSSSARRRSASASPSARSSRASTCTSTACGATRSSSCPATAPPSPT